MVNDVTDGNAVPMGGKVETGAAVAAAVAGAAVAGAAVAGAAVAGAAVAGAVVGAWGAEVPQAESSITKHIKPASIAYNFVFFIFILLLNET